MFPIDPGFLSDVQPAFSRPLTAEGCGAMEYGRKKGAIDIVSGLRPKLYCMVA